ncbi:MAG: OstA-like protein, partial [Bacteroidota bacterium]
MRYLYILLFGLLAFTNGLTAQEVEQDTLPPEKVKVDRSDTAEGLLIDGREIRFLKKNVALRQGDVYMYCDSATIENNDVSAVGNVIIQQGDTLNIFADSLSYRGDIRKAELFGDVRLENKGQKLFTDRLNYDLNSKIASYFTGATLSNDTTHLVSKRGYYYVRQDQAFFKDSVIVFDPDFTLRSDTLKYSTKKRLVTLLGPTLITQDSARIYCESGFYQIKNKYAEFLTNPQYVKGEQEAYADKIIYDGQKKQVILKGNAHFTEGPKKAEADVIRYREESEVIDLEGNAHYEDDQQVIDGEFISYDSKKDIFKTEGRSVVVDDDQTLEADNIDYEGAQGIATGNVVWIDTADNITINCEHLFYNKETDYVKASGARPLVTTLLDVDTLFMTSDTLISFMDRTDSTDARTLLGYHDVRILKNDLQAICDSMVYHTADSLFEFFVNPIIWSDTSQFYADTVRMQMANDKIDRIFLTNNAYIINSPDEVYFNQIKGKDITAFFEENELDRMEVVGNAESIYYARDEEDAYLGVNKAICSKMLLYFAENEIKDIYFYTQPKSNILPMKKTNHEEIKLPGFRWDVRLRPSSLADLLVIKKGPSAGTTPPVSKTFSDSLLVGDSVLVGDSSLVGDTLLVKDSLLTGDSLSVRDSLLTGDRLLLGDT